MSTTQHLLAKSASHGGELSLRDHTQQVMAVSVAIAGALKTDERLARLGAALHDLGKAHADFQRKVRAKKTDPAELNGILHRHELSSLGFLPLAPREDWPTLVEMVVAHHKPIRQAKNEQDAGITGKGILDLDANSRTWLVDHLQGWDDWAPQALAVLQELGIPTRDISRAEAQEALLFALAHCKAKGKGWSEPRGLLMAADHFASALTHEAAGELATLFKRPHLGYFNRSSALYPLSLRAADQPQPHTLVVAPTGAGKTDYLLRRCRGRVFYTLPFQASINAMFERLRAANESEPFGGSVGLLHATSQLVEERGRVQELLQPLVGASIKVLTPHQLAAIVFGTPGFEAVMLDVRGCDVILDEVHTYAAQAQAMVLEIVDALRRLSCRLHIGTATMPSVLYAELLRRLGGPGEVAEVHLDATTLAGFDRHQVHKLTRDPADPAAWPAEADAILTQAFAAGEKVLVICNTVHGAQQQYRRLRELFPDVKRLLLHSRFRRGDRAARERTLETEFNNPAVAGPCLVVSTQVVEVSLDISFDRMLTEAAPLDALVQRFGRVNRRRTAKTVAQQLTKPVHVLAPGPSCLPYRAAEVKASYAQLPDNGQVLREQELQDRIDAVYPVLSTWDISTHVIWDGARCKLRELCNNTRSVLIDALEIESTACILERDLATYTAKNTPWQERVQLEIPVNWRSMRPHLKKYHRPPVGAMPFVIPGNADYEEFGLLFDEHDIFLEK